jgi:hypothetical protein
MRNDNPDTIAIEESHWQATVVDDVFLPSVRVQLGWKDIEAAVESGAVVPQQAHALWAGWASPMSGLRVAAPKPPLAFAPTQNDLPDAAPDDAAADGLLQRHGLLLGVGGSWLLLGS